MSLEAFVKIREPEGALGWVDKKSLTDKRTVLITLPKAQIRVKADAAAAVLFEAEKGVALDLVESLPDGWAKVRHLDGTVGFVRSTQAWGI